MITLQMITQLFYFHISLGILCTFFPWLYLEYVANSHSAHSVISEAKVSLSTVLSVGLCPRTQAETAAFMQVILPSQSPFLVLSAKKRTCMCFPRPSQNHFFSVCVL